MITSHIQHNILINITIRLAHLLPEPKTPEFFSHLFEQDENSISFPDQGFLGRHFPYEMSSGVPKGFEQGNPNLFQTWQAYLRLG